MTDLRIRYEEAEQLLEEWDKEWKGIHEDLLRRIQLLIKEKVEKEEKHILETEEVITDAKPSAAVAIWEAKIRMAVDLENSGSTYVVGWHEALAKITEKPATAIEDHGSKLVEEEKEKNLVDGDNAKV